MIASEWSLARRGGAVGRVRALRPTIDRLETRDLMAVDLASSPIRATAGVTTGLIPVATIAVSSKTGASILPGAPSTATISPGNPGTATISWGDGTTSTAIAQVNSVYFPINAYNNLENGAILGAHTYARPGTYPIGVTLTDPSGVAFTTATTATVAGRATAGLTPSTANALTAATGVATGQVPVASFTDQTAKPLRAAAYKATVAWGDGTQSAGLVRVTPTGRVGGQSSATIEVLGSHTYTATFRAPAYETGVTVTLSRAGAKTSTTTPAEVTGANTNSPFGLTPLPTGPLTVRRGGSTGNLTVARYQGLVRGGVPPASDDSAQIDWGDGTTGAGTTRIVGGVTVYTLNSDVLSPTDYAATSSTFVLEVSGRHSYRQAGVRSVVTTLGGAGLDTPTTTTVRVR